MVLTNVAVKAKDIVNTKDIIAGSVPTGYITIKGPYGIVQCLGSSGGVRAVGSFGLQG